MDFFGEDHPTIGRTPEYREVHDPMDLDSTSHNITERGNSWPEFSRHHLRMDHLCLITVHIVCCPISGTMKKGCTPQLVRIPSAGSHHMYPPPPHHMLSSKGGKPLAKISCRAWIPGTPTQASSHRGVEVVGVAVEITAHIMRGGIHAEPPPHAFGNMGGGLQIELVPSFKRSGPAPITPHLNTIIRGGEPLEKNIVG